MELKHAAIQFAEFLKKANRLNCDPNVADSIKQFEEFVRSAALLVIAPPEESALRKFQNFLDDAVPLAIREVKMKLPLIVERARKLSRWFTSHDLLRIAGFTYVEDSYTELLAWALAPQTHPASTWRRHQAWLRAIGLDDLTPIQSCEIFTQLRTCDGIPDIVVCYDDLTVVVEVKTGSREHAAPSGKMQTLAYGAAVREAMSLSPHHRVEVVYLTPDGHDAESADAKLITFIDVILSLTVALDGMEIDGDTAAAYRLVVTHLLDSTADTKTPATDLVKKIVAWADEPSWNNDANIVRGLKSIGEALSLLDREGIHE